MYRPAVIALLLALPAAVAPTAVPAGGPGSVVRHLAGNPGDVGPVRPTEAGLLLAGGGGDVDEAMAWLVARAGGGDAVVLRASGGDGYNAYLLQAIAPGAGGLDSVETLVFSDRAQAEDPAVLATIAGAELLWIAGGDQSRYARFWKGTPVAALVAAHARAGRPIGGTSAGLAILGDVAYVADFPAERGELDSETALADPFDPRLTLEADVLDVPLARGLLPDSHFSERGRLGRLVAFLARAGSRWPGAPLVGVGVDERTALAVAPGGAAVVFGEGAVHVVLPGDGAPERLAPGEPLAWASPRLVTLRPGSAPTTLDSLPSLPSRAVRVAEGHLDLAPAP